MKSLIVGFFGGIVFSVGLVVSQMINPNKVIAFLDISGKWDISLIFVMVGAIGINLILMILFKIKKPFFEKKFNMPIKKVVDRDLVVGAGIFGIGWGLAGICPGPGIVNLVTLESKSILFVLSMLIGMFIFSIFKKRKN